MIWLALRQFRTQGLAALALVVAASAYLLVTGLNLRSEYAADQVLCTAKNTCDAMMSDFHRAHVPTLDLIHLILFVTPALIGLFWGAPLIARELETGTYQLAWNQSVTRARWLTVKLLVVGSAAILAVGLLSMLATWWGRPLEFDASDRFGVVAFTTRDLVPFASAAFAITLGIAIGALMRRSVPAMAVTFAVALFVQIFVPTVLRPHLLPSTTVTYAVNEQIADQVHGIELRNGGSEIFIVGPFLPKGAWVVSVPPVTDASGQNVSVNTHPDCFAAENKPAGPAPISDLPTCLGQYHVNSSVTFQPASHYWPLQWMQSAIYLALAALVTGWCFWWLQRRRV